jgi:pilus assembly protein FimV
LDEEKADRDDEPTREMDPLARTQETPTIESPMIDRASTTLREKIDKAAFNNNSTEQTAELSLDDLGLDVDSLETTGSLEDTTALTRDAGGDTTEAVPPLRDDEMTQLAPSLGSLDRTMEAPRVEKFDIESTGTIYIDHVDLSGGDTVEQRRPDTLDSTASMKRPAEIDVDFDNLGGDEPAESNATLRQPVRGDVESARFSDDVFSSDQTASFAKIDLDVGEPLSGEDREPTNKVVTTEMELSELEPVTMSEVGTKLDLARAYMDMGDPDGARSILEEVVQEGTSSQKQEATRLLDSIR